MSRAEREYVMAALNRYWNRSPEAVRALPLQQIRNGDFALPPRGTLVSLPSWAEDVGVDGAIFVPAHALDPGDAPAWKRCDWITAAFWYLHGTAERRFEEAHGPIHSYAFRLKGWDARFWERAWVNRMALFLRRWAGRAAGRTEDSLFGALPSPEIILTHDVDAVTKTAAIRIKQTVFHGLNAVRRFTAGRPLEALAALGRGLHFFLRTGNYWCFDRLMALEDALGLRSHFNVYGGVGGWRRPPKALLFDPAYSVEHQRLRTTLRRLRAGGWTIGLHQSHDAWADPQRMLGQRKRVEEATDGPVTSCRQHWLRFSWKHTWAAQQEAGLELDTTLGFNDRPGFRNGAAVLLRPWDPDRREPMGIQSLPMVLMDSHLYDYSELTEEDRTDQIAHWLGEVRRVRGQATVIWHQRVMSPDYGWQAGYQRVLSTVSNTRN